MAFEFSYRYRITTEATTGPLETVVSGSVVALDKLIGNVCSAGLS